MQQRNGCLAKFTSQVIIKATVSKAKKCPSSSPYEVFWQSIKISGILWSLEAELPRGRKFPAVVEDHGERVAIILTSGNEKVHRISDPAAESDSDFPILLCRFVVAQCNRKAAVRKWEGCEHMLSGI